MDTITNTTGWGDQNQKCIISQFWRPRVQNQGVNRTPCLRNLRGRMCACLLERLVAVGAPWSSWPWMCWVGQKIHLDFSVASYRKILTNVLTNQIHHFSLCLQHHKAVFFPCLFTWSSFLCLSPFSFVPGPAVHLVGSWFPDQGWNLGPGQWTCRDLTTGATREVSLHVCILILIP